MSSFLALLPHSFNMFFLTFQIETQRHFDAVRTTRLARLYRSRRSLS